MADDIDIEEHDVLDNPIIRKIFPDISVIKKEISQYYEDVPNIKQEPIVIDNSVKLSSNPVIDTKADDDVLTIDHKQFSIKSHVSRLTVDTSKSEQNNKKKIIHGTKIILGSKPNKTVEQNQDGEINVNERQNISLESVIRIPKVLLQDIGEYIYQSNRYCENCKTLFPTKLNFHDHKVKSHSTKTQKKPTTLKVTLSKASILGKNKCNVCGTCFACLSNLKRHYKNVHNKIMTDNDNSTKNVSCIASISDKKRSLSKFDLGNSKSNKNAIITRNKHFDVKVALEKTKSENKPQHKKQSKQNALLNKSKCTICGVYLSNRANLNRHYKNIHKKKVSFKLKYTNANSSRMLSINKATRSQIKKANADATTVCFHCNEQFFDQKCLIEHMYEILEPKQFKEEKRNKIPILVNKTVSPSTKKASHNTKTKSVRLVDKLKFEHQDLDGNDSSSSETEKNKNRNIEPKTKLTTKHTQEKEQTECITDNESRSLDQLHPKTSRNKRKYDLSDDDTNSVEFSFLGTHETNENQISQTNSLNKKRKLQTEHKNARNKQSRTKTSKNRTNKKKIYTSNIQKTSTVERSKHDKKYFTTISKNENLGLQFPPNNTYEDCSKGAYVYECIYCTHISPTAKTYCMHMFGKHKVEKISRVNKVIFDRQCKYCPARNTKKNHNRHLRISHYDLLTKPHDDKTEDCLLKKKATKLPNTDSKKVKSFVLKSIVYNCSKCDIHFLSSCVAKDHEKHMELLINWKCSVCKKIFKKHDKQLHLKQHSFSKTVNVCRFNQSELSRLLYNCTKCAIHFMEERYLEHYSKCGNQTTDSVYCKDCDILIDKCGYASHEAYHKMGKTTTDIIVITGDIITNNQVESKSQEKSNILEELHVQENNQEEKKEIKTVKSEATTYYPMNCLTFCPTCKCYLSDIAINRKSHVEGRCSKIVKYTCPTCGLVFTNKTINTHRVHHKKHKGLKLQDFEFFDLKGIQIRPPIPEYPVCKNCDVIFVGRNAVKDHVCSEIECLTCEICNVKLSENAFKLHMNFHNYCMPNEKIVQSLNVTPTKSQQKQNEPENQVTAWIPNVYEAMLKTDKPETVIQIESRCNDVDKNIATSSVQLCNAMLKEKINNSQTVKVIESPSKIQKYISTVTVNDHKDLTNRDAKIIPRQDMKESNAILYSCLSCKITVDSYEKVIHHCQNHFSPNPAIPLSMKTCSKCLLKFETDTYEIHQKLHLSYDTIQVLAFDPTYFTSENDIWTRHIFASATPSVQKKAIEKSMYQHECRIKMEVIQQGPCYLTLYKCFRCGIFIDPECLILHVRDGCPSNTGKHPCSICGLPFISSLSRIKHEKIHRRYNNVRLKSYNILSINCEAHYSYNSSILNAMKQFVLYQCRTCDGIVDKSQRNNHKCNFDDLRKCSICGLLLYKDDFERHITKHTDLAMYNTDNMKVILFGNVDESIPNKALSSTFNGVVSDYKLYKCNKCEECENDGKVITRHVCTFDDSKWKCPKCSHYIAARAIKQHIKMHDVDVEFKTDNFTLIHFSSTRSKENNSSDGTKDKINDNNSKNTNNRVSGSDADNAVTELEKNLVKTQLHQYTDNNSEHSTDKDRVIEAITFYKCACGLHYMDEMTAKNHVKHCCPKMKIIRQNCSKCGLMFNPKELFSHILAHHGDKNKKFKYNIIELN